MVKIKSIKIIYLAGLFIWISIFSLRAQNKIDSLKNVLSHNLSDSLRIRTLVDLSMEYQYSDLKKSLKTAEEAIQIAETKDLLWGKAVTYHNIGRFYPLSGDFSTAAKYNNLALNLNYQLKDTLRIGRSYNNLGHDYLSFGKYDEAYFYFTQSYRMARISHDTLGMTISMHNIANVFKELGQYDRALDHLRTSQKMSDKIHDIEGMPYNYTDIGDIYIRKGQYDSALVVLNIALDLSRKIKLNVNDLEPNILIKIAKAYLHKDNYKMALAYYDSTYSLYRNTDNEFGFAEVDLGKGMVYLKEKKFDEAQKLIESSLEVAHQSNSWTLEIQGYQNLSSLHEAKGDFQNSLMYYKKYKELEDSLFSQGMQAKLLQDQVRFETESKEDQIKALTRLEELSKGEIKKQELVRNILVVVMALTGILLFTVYRSGQRRIRINKLLLEHQEEIKRRSIELEQLNQVKDKFFSIISHDLRSPMNALAAILDLLDNKQIKPEEFSKLNKELRIQFNHTKTLINNLLDWALLQMDKLRIHQEKIDLHFMAEENFRLLGSIHLKEIKMVNEVPAKTLGWGDLNMINLVFRNLILNAIKFTDSGGQITIGATSEGDFYVISVKDNGVGITQEVQSLLFEKTAGYSTRGTANEKGTGLGLILCKEFVERNGGRIWLDSEVGRGSTFFFTIKKCP